MCILSDCGTFQFSVRILGPILEITQKEYVAQKQLMTPFLFRIPKQPYSYQPFSEEQYKQFLFQKLFRDYLLENDISKKIVFS